MTAQALRRAFSKCAAVAGSGVGIGIVSAVSTDTGPTVLTAEPESFYAGHRDPSAFFEADTGIAVRYDLYESNDVLEGKLLVGNSGYDLVVPSYDFFAVQRESGLYQPLDKSKLPNYRNLDATLLEMLTQIDPNNEYAVPYAWGTIGFGINLDLVAEAAPQAPLDSLELLFQEQYARQLAECGIALVDSPETLADLALLYLGYSPQESDPSELQEAMQAVRAIRPYVRYFNSGQLVDDFANGEVCLVVGWSGAIYQAVRRARGARLSYVVPREGSFVWVDVLAVPADAPNVENAHRLIDFLMRADVAADFTNSMYYPNGNRASQGRIASELKADPRCIHLPRSCLGCSCHRPGRVSTCVNATGSGR